MKRATILLILFMISGTTLNVRAQQPQAEIMRIGLGMGRQEAHARLKNRGKLEKEERKRQEVWTLDDARVSHLLIGFDKEFRVRYVTAIARSAGPRLRYREIADLTNARHSNTQGNYKFIWEVPSREQQSAFIIIAHGRDADYLDSYSIKAVQP